MSRSALLIAFIALLAGAYLRFHHLGALQMSADEGATWAAADASSIHEVVAIQQSHNPGKLPLHDLILHGWITVFGDGLFALRALSALFGLATIVLIIPLTREIFRIRSEGDDPPLQHWDVDMIAALSALICAVSLIMIKYDREARMYGLVVALALAHLWFFLRALRRQSLLDYVALALLTSALIAVNPVTLAMLAVEGIWLLVILVSSRIDCRNRVVTVLTSGAVILAGLAVLLPALYAPLTAGRAAFAAGKFDWLIEPQWWEPVAFFNKATGSVGFPLLVALAAWGVWKAWQQARGALAFVLLIMWAPPLLLVAGSLLWRPMFVERYAIYSFPAFFILVAIGICQFDSTVACAAGAVAVVVVSLGHIHSYSMKTHEVDWSEAAQTAQTSLPPEKTIAVAPPYAVEVVRYYVSPPLRGNVVSYNPGDDHSAVAILAEHGVNPSLEAQVHRDYPHQLRHVSGVVVLSR
jgi:4-amino-4-deoxy-L-arabinose transferase-like glycosyltransferase